MRRLRLRPQPAPERTATRRQARPDQASRRARSRPDRFAPPPAVAFGQSGPPLRVTRRGHAGRGGETALKPNRETSNLMGINKRERQERAGRHDQEASGSAPSNYGRGVSMLWRPSCHAGGRTTFAVPAGRRQRRASCQRRRAGHGRRNGRVRAALRIDFCFLDCFAPPHGPSGTRLDATGHGRHSA